MDNSETSFPFRIPTIIGIAVIGTSTLLLLPVRAVQHIALLRDTEPALFANFLVSAGWYLWFGARLSHLASCLRTRGTLPDNYEISDIMAFYRRLIRWGSVLVVVGAGLSLWSYREGLDGDSVYVAAVRTAMSGAIGWFLWPSVAGAIAVRKLIREASPVIDFGQPDGRGGLSPIGEYAAASVIPSISLMLMIAFWDIPGDLDSQFRAILMIAAVIGLLIGAFGLFYPVLTCHNVLATRKDEEIGRLTILVRRYRYELEIASADSDVSTVSLRQQRLEIASRFRIDVQQCSTWPLGLASGLSVPVAQMAALAGAAVKTYGLISGHHAS